MDWKKKAEEFLTSHLNDGNSNSEEAAVYFLSREKKDKAISNTIDSAIDRWRHDKTRWSEECRRDPTKAASILRLMQWGEVGALKAYRENIFQNFGVPYSQDFYPKDSCYGGYLNKTSAFFPLIFPLFTSDIAIDRMSDKLSFLLHQWQNYLNDLFMRKALFKTSADEEKLGGVGQSLAMVISAYIFAAYRLGKVGINQEILDKSVQFLLDSQHDSGLWAYDQDAPDSEEDDIDPCYCLGDFLNSRTHVILGAIGSHAIFLANPTGSKRCIEKAAEWLLQHQRADGSWCQHNNPKYSNQVHTTVLVLDAIEMAEGGDKQLTFTPNMILGDSGRDNRDKRKTIDGLSIADETQTIIYKGQQFLLGGAGPTWVFFKLLFEKQGDVVTHKEIEDATGHSDTNKLKYDLVKALNKKGARELAKKIKNSHSVGFYLKM